ncbi:hypothetical protein [Streptomyces sp. NPDC046685]|uniref:hypothetical protein n=1 Tax=Streptomyces sp. NPDC046685 TaxID=3157202 RepID=UPI0033CA4591
MTEQSTAEQQTSGFDHPIVRAMSDFIQHLHDHPDDVAALETFMGLVSTIQVGVGVLSGQHGPQPERLAEASTGAHIKLSDAYHALKFASGFLHEAHRHAQADAARVNYVSTEFRMNIETTARFFSETYQVFAGKEMPAHQVQAIKVKTDYAAWCKANTIKPLSDEKFQRFCRFPFKVDRSTGTQYVLGIEPKSAIPAPSSGA